MPMHASSRPRGRGKPHLLIVIEGGGVKEVISDTEGVTYDTLDWDNVREGEGVWEFLPLYVEPTVVPSIEAYMAEQERESLVAGEEGTAV